jgi:HD superfamily phosphodiesterase
MELEKLENMFLEKCIALYSDAKNPLRSHGPDHHKRVWRNARKISKSYPDADMEILVSACFLHDIAAFYPDEVGDKYHDEDWRRAEEVLIEMNFDEKKRQHVIKAIASHGSDAKYKKGRDSIESQILCDADKMDVFGRVGCARIVMVKALRGADLKGVVDDFYYGGHLQRKWEAMTLPESKALIKKDYEYSVEFFKKLAEELEM